MSVTHDAADKHVPAIRRAFVRTVNDFRTTVSLSRLENGLRNGQPVEEFFPWMDFGNTLVDLWEPIISQTLQESAYANTPKLGRQLKKADKKEIIPTIEIAGSNLRFSFNLTDPLTLAWIQQHTGMLITGITAETRDAIRALVFQSFKDGIPPRKLARMIRDHIGLTTRQSQTFYNFQRAAEERVNLGIITEERAATLIQRYQGRMIADRATNIARSETMMAANQGTQEMWRQAADSGLLNPNEARRIWILTRDEKLCFRCAPIPGLNPRGVRLDEPFKTLEGEVPGPILHPSCRCTTGLIFPDANGEYPVQEPAEPYAGNAGPPRRRRKPKLPPLVRS